MGFEDVVRAQVGTSNGGYEESLGDLPSAAAVPLVTPEVSLRDAIHSERKVLEPITIAADLVIVEAKTLPAVDARKAA